MRPCSPGNTGLNFDIPTWFKYLECDSDNTPLINNLSDLIKIGAGILEFVVWLAGVVAVFFVIYGGIKYIMSQGVPDKLAQARNTLIYAVAGLIVAIIADTAIQFVMSRFSGG